MSRITEIRAWKQSVRLKRPYTIASGTRSQVDLMYLRLVDDDGHVGLGSASPAAGVTGETAEACLNALQSNALQGLQGEDPRRLAVCSGTWKSTSPPPPRPARQRIWRSTTSSLAAWGCRSWTSWAADVGTPFRPPSPSASKASKTPWKRPRNISPRASAV
ncbi:MAG: hypothetical protein MI919_37805 [Holophagales bacterium]|nr:hypothetical protein [Holophagales bacterium]